ncbi:Protein involved in meta-pathway of phenol degradation [Candidatus Burkholderia verschuerenii]|uniref:Protein involved in meta-pathway of phenol degradation n=1 Tax=Candidatus Burkholderia verschuerenii TaxID=242163 RepID=A0A0L0MI17_9BURK|nr:transporter [Candidatus Burkholderia verschuerenii]KND61956.1 Protein involved in meta-pathway of phenol degradation [Candidatus Burkholderia verschuerenii]
MKKPISRGIALAALAVSALGAALGPIRAWATEGGLGRPVAGTSALSGVGIVPPEPMWIVSLQQLYIDGTISGNREVPVGGRASLGLEGKASFTLATLVRTWGGYGGWDFASGVTLPYVWTEVGGTFAIGQGSKALGDRASNLYDMYFTPIEAGYHFSQTDHIALSFNFWAPTGNYEAGALANPGLNTWTFVPQIAWTHLMPKYGLEFDAVLGLQFYTRNTATDYQNAPLLTLDLMGLKKFANGVGVGVVMGTVQQLGHDSGPTADRLDGFVGHDFTLGPILTYDCKIGGKTPLSASLRWVPSIQSTNRLKSTKTFLATATLAF